MADPVLLVDDEPLILNFSRIVLERAGYEVVTAENGRKALEVFDRLVVPVPVLVTDIRMPEMGGLELARRIKAMVPSIRIIFLSGYPASDELVEEIQHGGASFLSKPFSAQSLSLEVEKAYSLK
ncbi:MAG: domain S-box [Fibrobacteres bacterium]|nr:domain S-box [Fibrobacterota bacterium]